MNVSSWGDSITTIYIMQRLMAKYVPEEMAINTCQRWDPGRVDKRMKITIISVSLHLFQQGPNGSRNSTAVLTVPGSEPLFRNSP